MFPLTQRILIRGCEAHIKAGLGCAADYVADYVPLYAPFDGVAIAWSGVQGGNWLNLTRPNGDVIQFAHLSKYHAGGEVKMGELLAITGNSGTITTGPHKHIQIKDKDGNRIDPETYDWEEGCNLVDLEMLKLLYLGIFKRKSLDQGALGYIGMDTKRVLKILIASEENKYYTGVFKKVKALENWARKLS